MLINEEQIKTLEHLEQNLYTALNFNYKRNTSKVDNMLVLSLLEQVTGKKQPSNLNCSACVLKLYKQMGKIYFESKEALNRQINEAQQPQSEEVEQPATEEEKQEQKPKKQAKKKTNKKTKKQ